MGWLFTAQTKAQLIRELIAPNENERLKSKVLDFEICEDGLWSLVHVTAKSGSVHFLAEGESTTYIRLDLLEQSSDGWGYKTLDESAHPYYYSCPLRILEAAPVQSEKWRELVRASHAQKCARAMPA